MQLVILQDRLQEVGVLVPRLRQAVDVVQAAENQSKVSIACPIQSEASITC